MSDARSPPAIDAVSLPPRWSVREANGKTDAFYLFHQWDHYFGIDMEPGQLPHELRHIAGWIDEDEDVEPILGLVAVHDPIDREGPVAIGGGLASILPADTTVDKLPEGRFDADALSGSHNAWMWFGAVDPSWRGLGVGRALFQRRMEWARAHGADMAFAYGWERRGGRTSRPLFEDEGWVPIQRFDAYYAGDGRHSCPDCGAWPSNDVDCRCEMTLWALDLA